MPGRARLTRKQQQAIAALLSTKTIAEAANVAGIGERTLKRWLAEDDSFLDAYKTEQRRLVDGAINKLRKAAGDFVDALHQVSKSRKASAAARAQAARGGLEVMLKAIRIEELERRVAELEKFIGGG